MADTDRTDDVADAADDPGAGGARRRRGRSRTIDLGPDLSDAAAPAAPAAPAAAAAPAAEAVTATAPSVVDDAEDADATDAAADADVPDDDLTRFLDRRRPWLRPITERDRRRRVGGLYWTAVYVLLMAGISSVVGFVAVRGYLFLSPNATATGADVARQIVPWVVVCVYLGFAAYVTRNWRRTLLYLGLFLSPVVLVVFLASMQGIAEWLVSWIPLPGPMRVYGLLLFAPLLAIVLLGRDFVRWQLWVEYPDDTCWECGTRIADDRWMFCPMCANDLQLQRLATAEAEAAEGQMPGDDVPSITDVHVAAAATAPAKRAARRSPDPAAVSGAD